MYPTGTTKPTASNVNYDRATAAALAFAKVGSGGKISVYSSASTDVIVDLFGWLPPSSDIHGVQPTRLLDTRYGIGGPKGILGAKQTVPVLVEGRAGVPTTGVFAVILNVTTTLPPAAGHITAYPTGAAKPTASMLNFVQGQTVSNSIVVGVGEDSTVSLYTYAGGHVIVDIQGYITG